MRVSLKVLAGLWALLFVIFITLFFNAYSKFQPDVLLSILNEQVSKNYPDAKLTISNIDTKFSVDFNLSLKDLYLKRGDKTLAYAGEVEVKIPWWLILFDRGNAQVNVSDLDFYLENSEVVDLSDSQDLKSVVSDVKSISLKIPKYLSHAQYTFRAKNVSVREMNSTRRYITISKFLLREFKYGQNSAFEVNVPVDIKFKSKDYSTSLWIFGDVTPQGDTWKLNYRGEFKNKESVDRFKLEEILVDGKAEFKTTDSDVVTSINILFENNNIGQGHLSLNKSDLVLNLDFNKLPITYIKQIGEEIKNPYWAGLDGYAEGKVTFFKSLKSDVAKLKGKFLFDGKLDLSPEVGFNGKWILDFHDSKWETSFISPQGEVSLFRRAIFDFEETKVIQYTQEFGFSGVDINQAIQSVLPLKDFILIPQSNFFTTTLSFKKCVMGEKIYDGNVNYGNTPEQKYFTFNLGNEGHSLTFNYQSKNLQQAFELNAKKFIWQPTFKFLDPFLMAGDGIVNGTVNLRWKDKIYLGEGIFNLEFMDLKDIAGVFTDFNQRVWKSFNIDFANPITQNTKISFSKSLFKFHSVIQGTEPAVLSGQFSYPSQQQLKQFLTLSYPKNKLWKPVKKDITENFFPQDEQ